MTDIQNTHDIDPTETKEWLDSISSVVERDGDERAQYLLGQLHQALGVSSGPVQTFSTAYRNTIATGDQPDYPGNLELEKKLEGLIRWNAAVMVARANKKEGSIGGHIGTFASSCTLYQVGFNHFWHAQSDEHSGDLIFFQGHGSPGAYARSFIEGRLTREQMENFRREVDGKGISSYPHPWLMPEYWQFATVSMGLGPIGAIYQARFMKYLDARGLANTKDRHVWAFLGDGEMDEPESMGAITRAGREKLDNLIFVINCNLQRLDGLVHGNGKIIQEFESSFRGAGWNVIKVVWGSNWEPLFAQDQEGILQQHLNNACDGDFQTYRARGGAYMREHFFGQDPKLANMVANMTDDEIHDLARGGHDPIKVYSAYKAAVEHEGQPTVILAKTIKGFGMGEAGESRNTAHNQKKLKEEELKYFRDHFNVEVPDQQVQDYDFYVPEKGAEEIEYMHERRKALGGYIPQRLANTTPLEIPHYEVFAKRLLTGTAEGREMSTTTAFVQMLTAISKDKAIGERIVPITPDESRTFGMEGLFRQLGIYNTEGQRYEPEDRKQVMWYKESEDGQILQEGINEGGAMSSWVAAGTAYSTHNIAMIPFYIFYSMFGFQRVMDYIWMAADMRTKGFLLGATAGRTTINGEGLQHEDGHSHVMAGLVPNCKSYDPTYAYELAVILWHGMKEMYAEGKDCFYYITMMNENYAHPEMPKGCEAGIIKGLYQLGSTGKAAKKLHVQLIGSGSILREVEAAAELLKNDFNITADIWSLTSSNEVYRDGQAVARWNRLHADKTPKASYLQETLGKTEGPIIASTDYVKLYCEQLRPFMPRRYEVLGTDGFGRSDTREQLRSHFEVDRYHVVVTALKTLADDGVIKSDVVTKAIKQYKIDTKKVDPLFA